MNDDTGRGGITPVTFFGVVVQIFISMSIVLWAMDHPEGGWYRAFVQVYLLFMIFLYLGAMLWLLWNRGASKNPAATPDDTRANGK